MRRGWAAIHLIALAALGAAVSGCANTTKTPLPAAALGPPVPACPAGEKQVEMAKLFFGRNVGDKAGVSEADWGLFVDREIAPRFPEGMSVMDTAGVWRGADGKVIHELGKSVVLVLDGKPDEIERIAAVRTAYETKFAQQSELSATTHVCVAF